MKNNIKFSTKELTFCGIFVVLIAVCSYVSFPSIIPITLQLLPIFFLSYFFDLKCGMLTLLSYFLLGIIGVPVFSNFTSGIGVLISPTGGYLLGFFVICIFINLTKKFSNKFYLKLIFSIIALVLCYTFGSLWFALIYLKDITSIGYVISTCVLPFIIFDIIKILIAIVLSDKLKKLNKK